MELKELLGDAYKEGITLDEVTEALKGITLPTDQSAEIEKLKNSLSKSNSEAKDWKEKYRQTQDEATRKKDEDAEATKKLQEELEALKLERTIAGYKASYLEIGYEAKDAEEIAKALAGGDTGKVLEIQKRHQETLAEQIKKDLLKGTHRPGGAGKEGGDTDDDDENVKLAREMGKASAGGAKTTSDIMKHYIR